MQSRQQRPTGVAMTVDPENVRPMQAVTEGDQPSTATSAPEPPAMPQQPAQPPVEAPVAPEPAEPAEVPPEPQTAPEEGATPDLNEMTHEELDALAEERGIDDYPKSGVKDEKIQALEGG